MTKPYQLIIEEKDIKELRKLGLYRRQSFNYKHGLGMEPRTAKRDSNLMLYLYGGGRKAPKNFNVQVYKRKEGEYIMYTTNPAILESLLTERIWEAKWETQQRRNINNQNGNGIK